MNKKTIFLVIIFLFKLSLSSQYESKKFVIGVHFGRSGFFSIFNGTLNKLIWAKKNNKIPVVIWNDECLYYHKNGYHNFYNAWEYYFQPVSNLKYKSHDTIYKNYKAPDGFYIPYASNCYDDYFHKTIKFEINKVIKQYVKLKPYIKSKIDDFYNQNMKGYKIIGIHLRGTDKTLEARTVDPNKIIYFAKDTAKIYKNKKCKFFVATDEEKLLKLAKSILKKDVIYCNSHRSKHGEAIHYSKFIYPPLLGEEVLIETILLSKCNAFVHTRSNVATAVMLFNPHIRNFYFPN